MKFLKTLLNEFKAITGNDGGWWIPAAMAAYGMMEGANQRKQAQRQNMAAATQTEFSPWTKMGAGRLQSQGAGAMGGAVKGGLTGMSMQQAIENANKDVTPKDTQAVTAAAPVSTPAAANQVPMQAAQAPSANSLQNTYVAAPQDRNAFGQDWFNGPQQQVNPQNIGQTYVAAPQERNQMGQDWFNGPQQQSKGQWGQLNNLYAGR